MVPFHLVVTDLIFASARPEAELAAELGGQLTVVPKGASEEELVAACRPATAILTCFVRVTRRMIEAAPNLRLIVRYGTGTDTIDVAAAAARGVVVANVPEYCTDEVADHTLALLLACARGLRRADAGLRQGQPWSLALVQPLHSLREATVGLVGFGKIARAVRERLRPFGCRVLVFTRPGREAEAREAGAEPVPLAQLLARSDYVSLHLPLTPETRGLLGAEQLRQMKPTAYLINTARGGLVDPAALLEALRSGRLAGAALDVWAEEPPRPDDPLFQLENVLVTPHVAFYTEESLARLQQRAVARVREFFQTPLIPPDRATPPPPV